MINNGFFWNFLFSNRRNIQARFHFKKMRKKGIKHSKSSTLRLYSEKLTCFQMQLLWNLHEHLSQMPGRKIQNLTFKLEDQLN